MIFFIPIEVKIREFFSKTFLAYHIVKKGNEVIIKKEEKSKNYNKGSKHDAM